jgi:deazaflavin-dependent oxidoreductase (nitroreductase family)
MTLLDIASSIHIWLYRATRGRVGSRLGNLDVILLTTTGRKTGVQRTVVVLSFEDAGELLVVASASGARRNPAWFLNLKSNPQAVVQHGPRIYYAEAHVPGPQERDVLWQKILRVFPKYEDHQRKANRLIPVVRLVASARERAAS